MLDFLWKVIELFINRKNKFQKVKDVLERKKEFFREVARIDEDENLDEHEKRALKNALAQVLCGSRTVNYDLVDYYLRNKNFRNFEIISPLVAFWEDALIKEYDKDGRLTLISIDTESYKREKRNIFSILLCTIILIICHVRLHAFTTLIFMNYLHVNVMIADYIFIAIFVLLIVLALLIFYGCLAIFDLKRLIKIP
ncbi:hypothetical protein [Acinetobacter seifertii]|uniref:hypothetical protein n=1 Tax=Acinetobacter seifertii TaxID=1530123 RepID=UPI001BA59548|nr:hypothetical protein [Acinetobacter seifertii]